ncbi:TerD family protein [Nocardia sp. NPDC051030]|uniref:TerD family protein n=1 Tax=Nocardia sp. NPDC051030 TaxID=3155162 RepID=UPI003425B7CD
MFIELRDEAGARLELISVGLGWDPALDTWEGVGHEIDLNVAALMFSGDQLVDVVYHEQLNSADGSIRHHGDSMTGEGRGDNELITVDLTRIASPVTTVLFLVTCYTGQPFSEILNAFCRMVDGVSGTELVRYDLSGVQHTGLLMGEITRPQGAWQFREINAAINARHPVEAAPQLGPYLS